MTMQPQDALNNWVGAVGNLQHFFLNELATAAVGTDGNPQMLEEGASYVAAVILTAALQHPEWGFGLLEQLKQARPIFDGGLDAASWLMVKACPVEVACG